RSGNAPDPGQCACRAGTAWLIHGTRREMPGDAGRHAGVAGDECRLPAAFQAAIAGAQRLWSERPGARREGRTRMRRDDRVIMVRSDPEPGAGAAYAPLSFSPNLTPGLHR